MAEKTKIPNKGVYQINTNTPKTPSESSIKYGSDLRDGKTGK